MILQVIRAGSIGLLFAILLSTTNHLTHPIIMENKKAYENRQIGEMVGGRHFIAWEHGYKVYESEQPFGFVKGTSTNKGYNGEINLLVAYDVSGRILAVRVTEHRETPGLGDAIDREWIDVFNGKEIRNTTWSLKPKGDFDSITGATITSRAVIAAVGQAVKQ